MERINQGLIFDGMLFKTRIARGRYIGLIRALRPQWLKGNPREWVKITDAQKAAPPVPENKVSQEPDALPSYQPERNRSCSNDGCSASFTGVEGTDRGAQATADPSQIAKAESYIAGRSYVSAKRLTELLGVSERTLSRWCAGGGPPQVRIQGLYFELEKALAFGCEARKGRR
jgi:hypothetical protein